MQNFDVQKFIDEQKIKPIHYRIMLVCILLMFLDGFDIFLLGKIAPAISDSFQVSTASLTSVFVAQQIGLSLGAFLITPFADKIGRKRLLIWSSIIFGILTFLCAFTTSITELTILRGVSGFFLAGVVPIVLALITEFMPKNLRSILISVVMTGYILGNMAGGVVAIWLLETYGWQSGFWIGGIMPMICALLIALMVPESLPFLVSKNAAKEKIAAVLKKLGSTVDVSKVGEFQLGTQKTPTGQGGIKELLQGGRKRLTIIFWVISFISMGTIALMASWLPSFFREMSGIHISEFAVILMIAYTGAIVGTFTIGWFLNRFSTLPVLITCYIGWFSALLAMGIIPFHSPAFLPVMVVWSFCQAGSQTGINILIARVYPVHIRSTGIGWSGGAGRIGGIVAPALGGIALSQGASLFLTMSLISIPILLLPFLLLALPKKNRVL